LLRIVSAVALVVSLAAGWVGLRVLLDRRPPLRGELVDIGGRRLRIVCEGPLSDKPLVILESGAFGFAADWGAVQMILTERGVRSCAYDRAGLGFSDPGPYPRDGLNLVGDLEKLLQAKGETGPLVLAGHSMAGLYVRLYALRNPARAKGLLLIDAMAPETAGTPRGQSLLKLFNRVGRLTVTAGRLGLLKAAAPWAGDAIGLDGPAHAEKLYFFAYNPAIRVAADELSLAKGVAEQVAALGQLDPALPVGAITEGQSWGQDDPRLEGAKRSRYGWSVNIPNASHASMLGRDHASVIADGVERVLAATAKAAEEATP
jgi:pimeloyl-ACP methyl ester carboxylesterase